MSTDFEQLLELPELNASVPTAEMQQLIELAERTNALLTEAAANQKRQTELLEQILTHSSGPITYQNSHAGMN